MRTYPRFGCRFAAALAAVALLSVSAAAVSPTPATVRVDASRDAGAISPMLYGQFAEFMFEDVKSGLHAELLRDRDFEEAPNAIGLPRGWDRDPDDRNDDPALAFRWDDSVAYPDRPRFTTETTEHALRVDVRADDGRRRGLFQSRVPIRKGVGYRGYLWMKTSGYEGRVTVALERDVLGGERYASAEITGVSGDWRQYGFSLTPSADDPLARFAVLFAGKGRVWIDQASLLPGDAVGVVRADVHERVARLRPAFLRWPGGNVAQDYHWTWGVGPRDERTTWTNYAWANEREPSDFGTDEFVAFCRSVGAEPSITINVEGRGATPEEAAAWVEYCNGPATSTYGRKRAANGHPEPYDIHYWEVGNEIWGDWVRAHTDAETYARNFNRYAAAMRAVDPTIKLIACGDNDLRWNRTVLREAGANIDYLAVHHYYGFPAEISADPLNLMARPLGYERFYGEMRRLIAELVPNRDVRLAINEWNTTLPMARQHSMESALYAARLMNVFERTDLVAMSAVSDLVNGWIGGVIQASRHGVFVTPTYLVNELYANRLGTRRLPIVVDGPTFDTQSEGRGVPVLDVVASRSADGRSIYVKAVNTDRERPLAVELTVAGARVAPRATVETVAADDPAASNSFETPDAVRVRRSEVDAGDRFTVELPRYSATVLTLRVE
jgi:alpha-N-arabinofuranosidase